MNMTTILASVSIFCAALVVLDALPERWLTSDLVWLRVRLKPPSLRFLVASPWLLLEWLVNDLDDVSDGTVSGLRLLLICENWWTRGRGDPVYYRRMIVDSRERLPRERAMRLD